LLAVGTNPRANSRRTKISTREPSRRSLRRGRIGTGELIAKLQLIEDLVDQAVEGLGSREGPSKTGGLLKGKRDRIKGSRDLKRKWAMRRGSRRNLHLSQ
jgi:hypothetical protein